MNRLALTAACLTLAACNSPSKPAPAASSAPPQEEAAAPPRPAPHPAPHTEPVAVNWDVPSSWEPVKPPDSDRSVLYRINTDAGDADATQVAVRSGGSVDAIVERWKAWAKPAQGDAVRRSSRNVRGYEVVVVEVHGASSVLGAIVMSPGRAALEKDLAGPEKERQLTADDEQGGGPLTLEVRGPEKSVAAAKGDFEKVVESLRPR